MNQHYCCVVPLGERCHIANNLKMLGYRFRSFPFDWIISDFERTILKAVEHNFRKFLRYRDFASSKNGQNIYFNKRYCYYSYHDFYDRIPFGCNFTL